MIFLVEFWGFFVYKITDNFARKCILIWIFFFFEHFEYIITFSQGLLRNQLIALLGFSYT